MPEKKITTTKEEIREIVTDVIDNAFGGQKFKDSVLEIVESSFEGQKFKDSVEDVVMGAIAKFNADDLKPQFENIDKKFDDLDKKIDNTKKELMVEMQKVRDYNDKRIDQAEGRIIPKISTLTNVLREKDILNSEDVRKVQKAGVV